MALVQTPPRPPWEAGRHVDGGAIGQRHHRADTRHRHQAPAYLIVPDDGQQATMKHADLLAKRPLDNEQRFDQNSQIRQVLDKLLDARLEPYHFHHCGAVISSTILSFLRSETLRRISRNCFVSASIDA